MRRMLMVAALGCFAVMGSAAAQPGSTAVTSGEQPSEPPMFGMRGGRPTLTLADGNFTMQPVLRLDVDGGGFFGQPRYFNDRPQRFGDSNQPGVPPDPLNVRRARVGLQGTYLRDFTYNFTWEFGQSPGSQFEPAKLSRLFELQTAYNGLKWATIRFGAYTLMHTIEFSMSSFETTFMERPSIITVATSLASGDSRLAFGGEARGSRWFASAYVADGTTSELHDDRQRGFAGRFAGVPVNEDWVKVVVGINGAAQLEPGNDASPDTFRLRDRPELRLENTRLLDTRTINAGSGYAVGPEFAAMIGPVYLQSEYQWIHLDGIKNTPDKDFWGYYFTAAVPVIGKPRVYSSSRGVFTRPRFEELNPNAGTWGYLELAARYSYINLNDGPTRGGSQGIFGLALNYYPLSRLRMTLQYMNGAVKLDGPDRAFQALAGRLSFNW